MLKIIDILNTSRTDFKELMREPKYAALVHKKMKIIIELGLSKKIDAKRVYLLERVGEDDILPELRQFLGSLSVEWCEMKRGGSFFQFPLSEAESRLCDLQPDEAVLLCDFVLTDYCGYAWMNAENEYFIEAKKGGFYSFWEGKSIPTHYSIDSGGALRLASEHASDSYYAYNYTSKKWEKRTDPSPETVRLSDSERTEILDIMKDINRLYDNAKVAWIKSGSRIVIFDIWIMYSQGILE